MNSLLEGTIPIAEKIYTTLGYLEVERQAIIDKYNYRIYKRILLMLGLICVVVIVVLGSIPGTPKWFTAFMPLTAIFAMIYPIVISVKRHTHFKKLQLKLREAIYGELGSEYGFKRIPVKELIKEDFRSTQLFKNRLYMEAKAEIQLEGVISNCSTEIIEIKITGEGSRTGNEKSNSSVVLFQGPIGFTALPESCAGSSWLVESKTKLIGSEFINKVFASALGSVATERLGNFFSKEEEGNMTPTQKEFFNVFYVVAEKQSSRAALLKFLMKRI